MILSRPPHHGEEIIFSTEEKSPRKAVLQPFDNVFF